MSLEFDNLGGLILVALILLLLLPISFFIFDAFFSNDSDVTLATKNGLKRIAITLEDDQIGRAEKIPLSLGDAYVVGKQANSQDVYLNDGGKIVIDKKECKNKVCLCAFASKDDLTEKKPGFCVPLNSYECVYAVNTERDVNFKNLGKANPLSGFAFSEYAVFTAKDYNSVTGKNSDVLLSITNRKDCPGRGIIFSEAKP